MHDSQCGLGAMGEEEESRHVDRVQLCSPGPGVSACLESC